MTLLADVSTLATALFTGAAVYISFVEHPARLQCPARQPCRPMLGGTADIEPPLELHLRRLSRQLLARRWPRLALVT
jgi:hypothetical protein